MESQYCLEKQLDGSIYKSKHGYYLFGRFVSVSVALFGIKLWFAKVGQIGIPV